MRVCFLRGAAKKNKNTLPLYSELTLLVKLPLFVDKQLVAMVARIKEENVSSLSNASVSRSNFHSLFELVQVENAAIFCPQVSSRGIIEKSDTGARGCA